MSRLFVLLFGTVSYTLFLGTFLYLIGFVAGAIVPRHVDAGGPTTPFAAALAINASLIALFGIQHTIMARPWFKRWLGQYLPAAMERSLFVLVTCGIFALMFYQWRPLPTVLWTVPEAVAPVVLGVAGIGWLTVLLSTFLIDHFDLFGLRQVWLHFRGRPYTHRSFQERSLYRLVRHPLMLGFLVAFWAAPTMTFGRFAFAACYTLYIMVALVFEERDLLRLHGGTYRDYQQRVPRLLPIGRPRQAR